MRRIRFMRLFGPGAVASLVALTGATAQQAAVSGRVNDASTGQAVVGAQVSIVGSNLGAQTNVAGNYIIRGVAPGAATVRVLSIGYSEQSKPVTVTAGQTTTLNFDLAPMAIAMAPVVATSTGEQRRVEVGNAIAHVNATEVVRTQAISNVGDLLTSRAAGVMVVGGTQTGAGIRVRIRGTSSLSLTNNPIYIIDGIRVEGATGSSSVSVGGTTASRIGDLNPEEIESIEVVRGPSAATLYGTDAANGVIVITTKKGVAGRAQWLYYTEQTAITDRNEYPTAYRAWRTGTTGTTNSTASNTVQCFLSQVAASTCLQDSVTSYNLHEDKDATPYGVGYRQQHGLQVRGGSETVRYFLHGEWEDEDGVTKVPEFEQRYLAARGLSLRPEQADPNRLRRVTARANMSIAARDNLDISVNTGYTTQDLRLPRSDDSGTAGIAANTYGGPGFKYNLNAAGDTLYGWREFTPRDVYETTTTQAIERLITSVSTNFRPRDWLTMRSNFGLDYIHRGETQLCRFGDCTSANDRLGFKTDNRTSFFVYTLDAGATASRQLSTDIESQTSVGLQYYRNVFTRNGANGDQLPPGATTVTAGSIESADETSSESRTLGGYLEQRIAFRDRLFLTGALRSDRNSAFGADFKTVFYPKLSASWVISDEEFFPRIGMLNQLRLRSAYGASGVQPGTTDAVRYYSSTATLGESGEVSGVVFTTLGNPDLKPERSAEIEVGFDGSFWNNRLSTEITYYSKSSRDALISRVLPPSLGTGATARFENLGEVRNWGWEGTLNAQLIQSNAFNWDIGINGSLNSNELVELGGVPPITSATLHQKEGFPLNGWWSRRLVDYTDKNGNGIIEYNADQNLSEITVSDTAEYHGYSAPRREFALTTGIEFWQRRLRLAGMVDYKGGHLIYNNTERIRCASRFNCAGLLDPNASLFEQARTVLVREHPARSVAGFFEKGDFLRAREASLTFLPDADWTERWIKSRNVVATFAVRNLGAIWTNYSGVDPEAFGTTGDSPSSFQAFAPPTYFSFRLSLGF
ncbi:MAG: SusC/RagA family TonB-linked outer membrane protein [Gemmatimonadota bacterium]